jgi:hypothetical protein
MAQVLCILQQYIFYVLLPYSTSCIYYQLDASWCSSDDNTFWVLALQLLLLNFLFLHLGLWLHNYTRDFSLSTDGLSRSPGRTVHAPVSSSSIFSFSVLDSSWFLIFWAAVSYFIHFYFNKLSYFCRQCLAFLVSRSCTNLVSLSLHRWMYSLRPTIAEL